MAMTRAKSKQITHKLDAAGAATVNLHSKLGESVSVKDFGAVGDGVTDDTAAIQAAVAYCLTNSVNLVSGTSLYKINGTIYLQKHEVLDKSVTLDFGGSTFYLGSGGTLFESGKLVGGVWTSIINVAAGSEGRTFNVNLQHFSVNGGSYGVRVNDWHQGCSINNISSSETSTIVDANNCFYSKINNVQSFSSDVVWADERFIIRGESNLMTVSNCGASNSGIGYKFSRPGNWITSITFTNNSVEGCGIGIQCDATVWGMSISDNYFENISDVAMKFTGTTPAVTLTGNYFNLSAYPTSYVFELANSISSKVVFDQSNVFSDALPDTRLYKNGSSQWASYTINKGNSQSQTFSDIYIDGANFPLNTVVEGYKQFGFDEGIVKLNRGIIPANYTGRTTRGYALTNKFYGAVVKTSSATSVTYSTKILFQDRQLLFVGIRVADGGNVDFNGLVMGTSFWQFGTSSFAKNANVTITTDASGFVEITISGLTNYSSTRGTEVRVL